MAQTTTSPLSGAHDDALESPTVSRDYAELRQLRMPAPRPRIAARIDDLAELIGGQSEPLYCGPFNLLVGACLPLARMIILGTACRRPLLWEEARDLQAITGNDIVVLRLEDTEVTFTCDFFHGGTGECHENLTPWRHPYGRSLWLAPPDPSGAWIRLLEDGSQLGARPWLNQVEAEEGFAKARTALPAIGPGSQHG